MLKNKIKKEIKVKLVIKRKKEYKMKKVWHWKKEVESLCERDWFVKKCMFVFDTSVWIDYKLYMHKLIENKKVYSWRCDLNTWIMLIPFYVL